MGMTDTDDSRPDPPSRARLAADLARVAAEEHWESVPNLDGTPDLTAWVQSQRSIEHPVGGVRGTRRRKWKGGVNA